MNVDTDAVKARLLALAQNRTVQFAVLVFFVALLPRLMFMEHGLWQDEGRAMMIARNLLAGDGFTYRGHVMQQHPVVFYLLLAASFLVLGAKTAVGVGVVNVLGAATAALVYLIGTELYGRRAGIAAGVLLAVAPTHWFISERVLTDVPVVFFITLTAYLFLKAERLNSKRWFYASVVAAALAALTKLTGLLILPVLALYAVYRRGFTAFTLKRYWTGIGIFAGLFGLWELRNILAFGRTVAIERGLRVFFFISGQSAERAASVGVGNTDPLFYVLSMHSFLGLPALIFFLGGLAAIALYDILGAEEREGRYGERMEWLLYGVAALGLILLPAGLVLGSAPTANVGVFLLATPLVMLFVRDRSAFALLYLLVMFTVFQLKTYNLLRYFLPFAPLAVVVAGYSVDRAAAAVSTVAGRKAGLATFSALAVLGFVLTFPGAAAGIQGSAQGYAGLDAAGEYLQENTARDATILAASTNQIAWYSDRENVEAVWGPDNASAADRYIVENGISYVEVDVYEPLVAQNARYVYSHYQQSPLYEAVQAFGSGRQPSIVIYRVVNATG